MSFAGKWMQMKIIVLSEISQTQKDKYHVFYLICGARSRKKKDTKVKGRLFDGEPSGGGRGKESEYAPST
jgi:hypothetical protein